MTLRRSIIVTIAVLFAAGSGFVQAQRTAPNEPSSSGGKLSLVGTVRNSDGSPAVGQVIYFAAVENGRVSTAFKIEDGSTTGLLDPNSVTDEKGRFRVSLDARNIDVGKEFTLGILDCPKCFTLPERQLMRNGLPLTFRIARKDKVATGTKEINLGVIVLD